MKTIIEQLESTPKGSKLLEDYANCVTDSDILSAKRKQTLAYEAGDPLGGCWLNFLVFEDKRGRRVSFLKEVRKLVPCPCCGEYGDVYFGGPGPEPLIPAALLN